MSAKNETATMVGVGAVACAACCAGPILGALSAIGIGTVAGIVIFGTGALVVALVFATALVNRWRVKRRGGPQRAHHTGDRNASCCASASELSPESTRASHQVEGGTVVVDP